MASCRLQCRRLFTIPTKQQFLLSFYIRTRAQQHKSHHNNPITIPSAHISTITRNNFPRQHSRYIPITTNLTTTPTTFSPNSIPSSTSQTNIINSYTPTLTNTIKVLTPVLTLCCHFSHASMLVDQMIAAKDFPRLNNPRRFSKHQHDWDLGSRFLRMPEELQLKLDQNGFFPRARYNYLNSELLYADPYIGEIIKRRRIPIHHAANYMDPYVRHIARKPGDPDYAMFNDEFKSRLAQLDWTESPVLFELIIMTRRKSLSQVDRQHQLSVVSRAPLAGMASEIDRFGVLVGVADPPNGPTRPKRPELKSPYPWLPGTDYDDIHFQL